jgi:hypothetical protein
LQLENNLLKPQQQQLLPPPAPELQTLAKVDGENDHKLLRVQQLDAMIRQSAHHMEMTMEMIQQQDAAFTQQQNAMQNQQRIYNEMH